eukprot:1981368-Rhodomonas_salina.5
MPVSDIAYAVLCPYRTLCMKCHARIGHRVCSATCLVLCGSTLSPLPPVPAHPRSVPDMT